VVKVNRPGSIEPPLPQPRPADAYCHGGRSDDTRSLPETRGGSLLRARWARIIFGEERRQELLLLAQAMGLDCYSVLAPHYGHLPLFVAVQELRQEGDECAKCACRAEGNEKGSEIGATSHSRCRLPQREAFVSRLLSQIFNGCYIARHLDCSRTIDCVSFFGHGENGTSHYGWLLT